MSKGGFMKDALILFAITLVAGACLGGVYEITKDPIAAANQAAKERAFREVLADADSFAMDDYSAALDKVNTEVKELDFGNVSVDECATGMDASGAAIGYVVTATSKDGYGGDCMHCSGASCSSNHATLENIRVEAEKEAAAKKAAALAAKQKAMAEKQAAEKQDKKED